MPSRTEILKCPCVLTGAFGRWCVRDIPTTNPLSVTQSKGYFSRSMHHNNICLRLYNIWEAISLFSLRNCFLFFNYFEKSIRSLLCHAYIAPETTASIAVIQSKIWENSEKLMRGIFSKIRKFSSRSTRKRIKIVKTI